MFKSRYERRLRVVEIKLENALVRIRDLQNEKEPQHDRRKSAHTNKRKKAEGKK